MVMEVLKGEESRNVNTASLSARDLLSIKAPLLSSQCLHGFDMHGACAGMKQASIAIAASIGLLEIDPFVRRSCASRV